MIRRYLAGQLEPGSSPERRVARVVSPDAVVAAGPLAVGATSGDAAPHDRTVCLLDGRVTSLEAIAAAAGVSGAAPAETLLARAYEHLGERMVALLRGEFVLLLVNLETRCALLVRDPLGARAVFVHTRGRVVTFASEVRDLLALLDVQPPPNPVAVAHWLARTGTLAHATLYDGVEKLPAGNLLRLGPLGAARERWWSPARGSLAIDGAQAAERVGRLMRAAVERALEGAARPGVMLSGGFDSGSIAVLAGRRARTYSAVFPDMPDVDESARIAAIRERAGLDGTELEVRGGSAVRASLEFLAQWRTPSISPNWFVWAPLLARARRDGVDVLVDGEAGDEVFGCAPFLIADRIAAWRPLAALRLARELPGMGAQPHWRWVWRALLKYGVRGAMPYRLHSTLRRMRGRGAPSWLSAATARSLRDTDDPWRWKRAVAAQWRAAFESQLVDGPDALGVPEQLAREAALAGVELRHPYRDEDLVENALAMPPQLSFDAHLDRPLAREAMRGLLPETVRTRGDKVVFNAVLDRALGGPDRETAAALLDDGAEVGAYVDLRGARAAALEARSRTWAIDLWRLVTLECWLRMQADPTFPARLGESLAGKQVGASVPP